MDDALSLLCCAQREVVAAQRVAGAATAENASAHIEAAIGLLQSVCAQTFLEVRKLSPEHSIIRRIFVAWLRGTTSRLIQRQHVLRDTICTVSTRLRESYATMHDRLRRCEALRVDQSKGRSHQVLLCRYFLKWAAVLINKHKLQNKKPHAGRDSRCEFQGELIAGRLKNHVAEGQRRHFYTRWRRITSDRREAAGDHLRRYIVGGIAWLQQYHFSAMSTCTTKAVAAVDCMATFSTQKVKLQSAYFHWRLWAHRRGRRRGSTHHASAASFFDRVQMHDDLCLRLESRYSSLMTRVRERHGCSSMLRSEGKYIQEHILVQFEEINKRRDIERVFSEELFILGLSARTPSPQNNRKEQACLHYFFLWRRFSERKTFARRIIFLQFFSHWRHFASRASSLRQRESLVRKCSNLEVAIATALEGKRNVAPAQPGSEGEVCSRMLSFSDRCNSHLNNQIVTSSKADRLITNIDDIVASAEQLKVMLRHTTSDLASQSEDF